MLFVLKAFQIHLRLNMNFTIKELQPVKFQNLIFQISILMLWSIFLEISIKSLSVNLLNCVFHFIQLMMGKETKDHYLMCVKTFLILNVFLLTLGWMMFLRQCSSIYDILRANVSSYPFCYCSMIGHYKMSFTIYKTFVPYTFI